MGASPFSDTMRAGVVAGVAHGLVEADLLRLVGLQITWADLALQIGVFAAAGALGGALLGLALKIAGIRPESWRAKRLTLALAALAYVAVIVFNVGDSSGAAAAVAAGGAACVGALVALRSMGPGSSLAGAAIVVSAICCAAFYGGMEAPVVDPGRAPAFFGLLSVFVLAAAAFYRWSHRLPKPVLLATALSAAWIAVSPVGAYGWRISDANPPLSAEPASGPDVVLIVLDTVRADHLELFGYERATMPRLTTRARRDFDVIMRSTAATSWTLGSHASMFTGLHAWRHGARSASVDDPDPPPDKYPLRSDAITLAETLGDAGYRTAAIAANFAILSSSGLERGFQHRDYTPGTPFLYRELSWLFRARTPFLPAPGYFLTAHLPDWFRNQSGGLTRREPDARRAAQITDAATRWLDDRADETSFLFVNYLDAHTPYLPLPENDGRFASPPPEPIPPEQLLDRYLDMLQGKSKISQEQIEFLIGQYDAEILGLDAALEELFLAMEQRGLYEDALVIVTSDHGEGFFEHGLWWHGSSVYESQVGVPLLIKLPSSSRQNQPQPSPSMQHVDFLPTIAQLTGLPTPPQLDGKPWGHGRPYALAELYCLVCSQDTRWRNLELFRRDLAAVVIDGKKAIFSTRDQPEYYDLTTDPGEQACLTKPPQELVDQARTVVESRKLFTTQEKQKLEPSEERKLRSLGYIN